MTLSDRQGAYADCYVLLEKALGSPRGIQRLCKDYTEAHLLRLRLNKARLLDRANNKRIFSTQPDHPLYDNSEFYALTVKVIYDEEREIWLCKMEKKQVNELDFEEIPGDPVVAALPWEEPKKEEVDDTFDLPVEGDLDGSNTEGKRGRRF